MEARRNITDVPMTQAGVSCMKTKEFGSVVKSGRSCIEEVALQLTQAGKLASELVRAAVDGLDQADHAMHCEQVTVEDLTVHFRDVTLKSVQTVWTFTPSDGWEKLSTNSPSITKGLQ